ncbi:MAG: DUF790 family protein [Myxococcales bacterium]|nr:DUF790 family protein [Myxococcales bacterium]
MRWKRTKDVVEVRPIPAAARPRLLEAAEGLLQAAANSVGESREVFKAACGDVPVSHADQRVFAGLQKLVTDRCTFEMDVGQPPVALRAEVFTRATAARRALDHLQAFDRGAVIADAAAALGLEVKALEGALFADLKDAHLLVEFEATTPEALLALYEREQERAALLLAVRVVVDIEEEDAAIWRNLFRSLKFHRLLYTIEARDGGYRVTLDGPQSLFSATRKYGLRLAMMLEPIRACARWALEADLLFGKPPERVRFLLKGERDGGPGAELPLPDDVADLVQRFGALETDWRVRRSTRLLALPGVGLCVPDLVFSHPDGTRAYLEVLGFWSRDAVWKRVDLVRAGLRENVLFAVTERLRVSEAALEDDLPGQLYVYKGVMSARRVLDRLEGFRPKAQASLSDLRTRPRG